jgi:dihydrolipoamide dehydrogenase
MQRLKKDRQRLKAKNMILATGSSASNISPFIIDNELVLDNIGILSLRELPKSLIVIGGGVIGSEFASIFNILGTKVTIVEIMSDILINEDKQVSDLIRDIFKKRGIDVLTDSSVKQIRLGNNVKVKLNDGKELEADKLLLSVGRVPNTKDIGLENAGIKTDQKGFIHADASLKTNVDNIYAIGDVIGGYQLAHVASKEGITAVENIAGINRKISYGAVPWAVFTLPEIGSVGMNESEAKKKGYNVKTGNFPFKLNGKAMAIGETEGFVKIVAEHSCDEILGATVIGSRASDIIHEITLAMTGELTSEYLAQSIHSHPTLSEAVMEAAEDIFGMATHKL